METTRIKKSIVKGRPKAQAGESKRERILENALYLFAKQGVSETTVAQIAERSGVTSAMVHYYFKNWEGLLDVIMEERIVPRMQYVWKDIEKTTSVPEFLEIFVSRLFDVMEQEPLFPELWSREVFNSGGNFRERFIKYYPVEKLKVVQKTFLKAQKEGQINPNIQAEHIIVSVVGLVLFPLIAHDLLSSVPLLPAIGKKAYKQHVLTILKSGLYTSRGNEA